MSSLQEHCSGPFIRLTSISDARGTLVATETGPTLPFAIERLFYIIGATAPRGFHAHREQHQLLVCAAGSCRVLVDDGRRRDEYLLDRPECGLHLPPMRWVELDNFSSDCVLLVLASAAFAEEDYIRDYATFLDAAREGAQP